MPKDLRKWRCMVKIYLIIYITRLIIYGGSKTCTILSLLMINLHERHAIVAKNAIFKERGCVNYKALIEIYVGRKSSHFFLIQQAYQSKFRRHLDQDIMSIEPPHSYQKILMAFSASQMAHSADVSVHIGKCDAQRLFQTGEATSRGFKIDEGVVLEILSKRSIPQLKLTFSIYMHIYGHSYTKVKHLTTISHDNFCYYIN
ncbi:uncharacterized protein LOC111917166 [Lactuca sativa]|uniref:uncharacterized protein LOC111917166 n=1 Tax=Lactuca sativa TaxID=4236 RepID=UPI000CD89F78|nr:uncharacterized protein LOC111917166 [Lactuca sativa]